MLLQLGRTTVQTLFCINKKEKKKKFLKNHKNLVSAFPSCANKKKNNQRLPYILYSGLHRMSFPFPSHSSNVTPLWYYIYISSPLQNPLCIPQMRHEGSWSFLVSTHSPSQGIDFPLQGFEVGENVHALARVLCIKIAKLVCRCPWFPGRVQARTSGWSVRTALAATPYP